MMLVLRRLTCGMVLEKGTGPWNFIEVRSKLNLTCGICGLSFGFNYVVAVMLFSLGLVLHEGFAYEA